MKSALFFTGLFLAKLSLALPIPLAQPARWYDLPDGYGPQLLISVRVDGLKLVAGTMRNDKSLVLNLNQKYNVVYQANLDGSPGTELSAATLFPYNIPGCVTAVSTAPPVSGSSYDRIAAVATEWNEDKNHCDPDFFAPAIWNDGAWKFLDITNFDLPGNISAIPEGFAQQAPEWLIGKTANIEGDYVQPEVVVWKYDSITQQYLSHQKLSVPADFYISAISQISPDARTIQVTVRTKNNYFVAFTMIYTLQEGKYISELPKGYQNKPIGIYPPLNATMLIANNGAGTYLNTNTFQLSPESKSLFRLAARSAKYPVIVYGSKGLLVTNPGFGYGPTGADGTSLVYQSGITKANGIPAFIGLFDYLYQACNIVGPPLSLCETGYLKMTAFGNNMGFGDCYNEDLRARSGFYSVDLGSCPSPMF